MKNIILAIDTTDRKKVTINLVKNSDSKCFENETPNQSDDLLILIDRILKEQGLILGNIKAILVNQGPGSYTGTRISVTVANTLAWSLNIPVFGYRTGNLSDAVKNLSLDENSKFSSIVLPKYEETLSK